LTTTHLGVAKKRRQPDAKLVRKILTRLRLREMLFSC